MDGTTPFVDGTLDSATPGNRRFVPGELRADPFDLLAFLSTMREGQKVAFAAKQPIFKQGDAADALYYILNGRAQLTAVSEHGRHGVLALFGIGDFIGEGCLSGQNIRPGSAITMTPVTAIKISRAAVPRLVQSEPRFMETLMQILSGGSFTMKRNWPIIC